MTESARICSESLEGLSELNFSEEIITGEAQPLEVIFVCIWLSHRRISDSYDTSVVTIQSLK